MWKWSFPKENDSLLTVKTLVCPKQNIYTEPPYCLLLLTTASLACTLAETCVIRPLALLCLLDNAIFHHVWRTALKYLLLQLLRVLLSKYRSVGEERLHLFLYFYFLIYDLFLLEGKSSICQPGLYASAAVTGVTDVWTLKPLSLHHLHCLMLKN